jgi:hypothetical protein
VGIQLGVACFSARVPHRWPRGVGRPKITLVAAAAPTACLGADEIHEAAAQRRVIEPNTAVLTARQLLPGAEVMRGGLCREGETLVYRVLVLRKDGHFIQVTIEEPSGKVLRVDPP